MATKNIPFAVIRVKSNGNHHLIKAKEVKSYDSKWINSAQNWPSDPIWFAPDDEEFACELLIVDGTYIRLVFCLSFCNN